MAVILPETASWCSQAAACIGSRGAENSTHAKCSFASLAPSAFLRGRSCYILKSNARHRRRHNHVRPAERQSSTTQCTMEETPDNVSHNAEKEASSLVSKKPLSCKPSSRRQLITLGAATAAAAFCPTCSLINPAKASAADWSYGSLSGPTSWGAVCSAGKAQSPIDLPKDPAAITAQSKWGSLQFQYERVSPSFYNTGHGTMQVDFPKGTSQLTIGNRTLNLLQYHFHAPSEHSFEGQRAAMEAHLVHIDKNGRLAVVGVMMQADPKAPRNLCLQAALEFAPDQKLNRVPAPTSCFFQPDPEAQVCPSLVLSPASLLPKPGEDGKHTYMNYEGSLTTPPCSEGVDWFVLANPVRIPGQQVIEFMSYVGDKRTFSMNSRPLQPLNERVISMGA